MEGFRAGRGRTQARRGVALGGNIRGEQLEVALLERKRAVSRVFLACGAGILSISLAASAKCTQGQHGKCYDGTERILVSSVVFSRE